MALTLIKGETVTIVERAAKANLSVKEGQVATEEGKTTLNMEVDPFNRPVEVEVRTDVENVLIAPTTSDDVTNVADLEGKKAVYTLAIPKGDTHNWENALVEFWGYKWHVFGIPLEGIEANIPLSWNKKVTVERYE